MFPSQQHRKFQSEEHSWFQQHSLSIVLWALFIVQTIVCLILYYYVWKYGWNTKQEGWGLPFFAAFFGAVYMTSLVADTYGALLLVVLTKYFYEQGSDEAKDPPEQDQDQ